MPPRPPFAGTGPPGLSGGLPTVDGPGLRALPLPTSATPWLTPSPVPAR